MNLNILPQQNDFNTNPNNLPQQKEYNTLSNNLPKKKGYNMKQINLSQSGRSMVEMLGSLAIIGVLSVGGIMGYSYGMDKWRANETIKDINLRRVDLLTQQNGDKNISLDAWKDEKTLYPISLVFDAVSDDPLIQVTRVPERVCEMIVKDMETQAAITVNTYFTLGTENGGCEEMNDLTFYFGDYDVCGTEYCSGNTSVCHPDTQTCVECMDSGDCPDNKPFCNASNVCETCPESKPFYDAATGICGDCQSDKDCPEGSFCFNNNGAYVNYENGPNLGGINNCWSISYDVVLTADESPDGKEWVQITKPYSFSHRNAEAACEKIGKTLPSLSDYGVNCTPHYHCNKTPTAIELNKLNIRKPHTWAIGKQDNKGLLINLSLSETRMHPYYFNETAGFIIFCHDK